MHKADLNSIVWTQHSILCLIISTVNKPGLESAVWLTTSKSSEEP